MKIVIAINAYSRKRNEIYRTCTPDYTITHTNPAADITPYLWKDHLRYQFIDKGSIIATSNNLGLVSIKGEQIENSLFKK
ncbi:hypothetical protein J7E81_23395 [Bacillus sp. ISL-18]|uniref:hypothetical protein n=1 Tax=Bacillus sp. ISL-18 TaxID=2819118 RepID=UPI001BE6259B|nr:hypothetical protein [Bacillus sp. ISL-18]MBT2658149.1 hypothetical protein [Bacillus sp. ISL-18]